MTTGPPVLSKAGNGLSEMSEHRYPRRWKHIPSPACKWSYGQQDEPRGTIYAYKENGEKFFSNGWDPDFWRSATSEGCWIEVFDHHHDPEETKILDRFERRRQFAYLKRIIREQREEIARLKEELSRG